MDAVIKIPSSEFNEEVFKRIKLLIKSFGNAEVTIAVSNSNGGLLRNETKEEYWSRINQSVADIEAGKGVVFTMEELENYIHGTPDK